ncbi:MarC family protein [Thiolapillus sp.]
MLETAAIAFTTFFATVAPVDSAFMFAALTADNTPDERRHMALRGVAIASILLLLFAFFGKVLLARLGISLAALTTAGGILLLLMGIDLVFGRNSGAMSTTRAESREAVERNDISVFPLATPLLAGPGTMGAVILIMANAHGDLQKGAIIIAMLLLVMLISLVLLLVAGKLEKLLGVTGMRVINRVFGVLLCSLAVQFVFDGIRNSGLFV